MKREFLAALPGARTPQTERGKSQGELENDQFIRGAEVRVVG